MLSQLPNAVSLEAQKKYEQLLDATKQYSRQHSNWDHSDTKTIWRHGNARLLDYGRHMSAPAKAYALLVPSLINRHYILDLSARRSFVKYIAKQGIYPLVLDWDEPGEEESAYQMADYVTNILMPAIGFASKTTGGPLHLLGYCLGGVLALAATQLAPQHIQSLALLATPWNFLSEDTKSPKLTDEQLAFLEQHIAASPTLHPMVLQWLFMLRQPFAFEQKFLRFGEITDKSERDEFIQIEHWVNDNVPMASPAALDCLIHWAQKNELYEEKWKVGGSIIQPANIHTPCFLAVPSQDTIVPTNCAKALATKLTNATICTPNAGHVGMVVGRNATSEMWRPYTNFILRRST